MTVNSLQELLDIANSKETDIEKLRVLQQYFIENVSYNYFQDIPHYHVNMDEKKDFNSQEEKIEEIIKFERLYGESFHLSDIERKEIIDNLGIKVAGGTKSIKVGNSIAQVNLPDYDGGIMDCIRKLSTDKRFHDPTFVNGLIVRGVCRDYSPFIKECCDYLNIKCEVVGTGTNDSHVFNIINIDGEDKVFDFTRMIGVRDDFFRKGQVIDDWFNIDFEKLFTLKPERTITEMPYGTKLEVPITKDNYMEYFNKSNIEVRK